MLDQISLTSIPNDIAKLILTDYFTPILSLTMKYDKAHLTISYPYINTTLKLPGPHRGTHIEYKHDKTDISFYEFMTLFNNNVPCCLRGIYNCYFVIKLENEIIIASKDHEIKLINNKQTRQQVLIMWTEYIKLCEINTF